MKKYAHIIIKVYIALVIYEYHDFHVIKMSVSILFLSVCRHSIWHKICHVFVIEHPHKSATTTDN